MSNVFEEYARERKAQAVAALLLIAWAKMPAHKRPKGIGCASEWVADMEQPERDVCARMAGQHPLSVESWRRVLAIVRQYEDMANIIDPFAGLTESDYAEIPAR